MSETPKSSFDSFIDHQKRAFEEASKAVEALIPPDARSHGRAAVNESIEGFRVLMNSLLDDLKTQVNHADDSAPASEAPKSTGKNKVKVEVNS
jgi:hypothetical protein